MHRGSSKKRGRDQTIKVVVVDGQQEAGKVDANDSV
jgi:hypothetical protein